MLQIDKIIKFYLPSLLILCLGTFIFAVGVKDMNIMVTDNETINKFKQTRCFATNTVYDYNKVNVTWVFTNYFDDMFDDMFNSLDINKNININTNSNEIRIQKCSYDRYIVVANNTYDCWVSECHWDSTLSECKRANIMYDPYYVYLEDPSNEPTIIQYIFYVMAVLLFVFSIIGCIVGFVIGCRQQRDEYYTLN